MPIVVNGYEITDADVEKELPFHQAEPEPLRAACITLVLRRVLLDEARELGHATDDPEDAADWLLSTQVKLPAVSEDACRRHYEQHPSHFTVGGWVDASHILFAVSSNAPLAALREMAQDTLATLKKHPERFEAMAGELSNCPSSVNGGALGQMKRGECVPEFDAALWRIVPGTIADTLIETRHGLHIVRVNQRYDGQQLPFGQVKDSIAHALAAMNQDAAWRQYVQLLLGRARVTGIELEAAETPLVQ